MESRLALYLCFSHKQSLKKILELVLTVNKPTVTLSSSVETTWESVMIATTITTGSVQTIPQVHDVLFTCQKPAVANKINLWATTV